MQPWYTIEKELGETPLEATKRLRVLHDIPKHIPLAYAGRLDPMATGTLLILAGDTCKVQERYHALDKAYRFEVLIGIGSDTHDILGDVHACTTPPASPSIQEALAHLRGTITLPYPHFSSRTVKGKPLHTWTLEKRLHEIDVPTKTSRIYTLRHLDTRTIDTETLYADVMRRINTIPPVTDPRKALGADFRRDLVRDTWDTIRNTRQGHIWTVHTLFCIASSGTYMRSLAATIGERMGTEALALSIHRTRIGRYLPIGPWGVWYKTYAS